MEVPLRHVKVYFPPAKPPGKTGVVGAPELTIITALGYKVPTVPAGKEAPSSEGDRK